MLLNLTKSIKTMKSKVTLRLKKGPEETLASFANKDAHELKKREDYFLKHLNYRDYEKNLEIDEGKKLGLVREEQYKNRE